MKYLTEAQIAELESEQFAREIAKQANDLIGIARDAGFQLDIINIAGLFGVALVRRPLVHQQETIQC